MSEELPTIVPGSAPEILQARLKQRQAAAAAQNPLAQPPADAPNDILLEGASDAPVEAVTSQLNPETNPFVKNLETYPDEDLKKLCAEKGVAIDGRWGRDRIIQALVDAANNQPTPPPAVVEPVAEAPVPEPGAEPAVEQAAVPAETPVA